MQRVVPPSSMPIPQKCSPFAVAVLKGRRSGNSSKPLRMGPGGGGVQAETVPLQTTLQLPVQNWGGVGGLQGIWPGGGRAGHRGGGWGRLDPTQYMGIKMIRSF